MPVTALRRKWSALIIEVRVLKVGIEFLLLGKPNKQNAMYAICPLFVEGSAPHFSQRFLDRL
jgi:hypothetical protein